MNRRGFLKFLGEATVGAGIVYSFPSIIVPKNISSVLDIIDADFDAAMHTITRIVDDELFGFGFSGYKEIFPTIINDTLFVSNPMLSYLRNKGKQPFSGGEFTKTVFTLK